MQVEADVFGAKLTRRGLLKAGGSLAVGFSLMRGGAIAAAPAETAANTLDATRPSSWIEIHADNTITMRNGKPDFGQGTPYTAFRQIVADELYTTFEAITTVHEGSTDTTPDGSGAFNFLWGGNPNVRKAAAYTFQALLGLAAQHFLVAKDMIRARDGSFYAGDRSITYGELVSRQRLEFTIPVSGNLHDKIGLLVMGDPPMKPVAEYTVIGKSFQNSMIADKVAAKALWASDVELPGMLHARIIHPRTLGSQLVSAGSVDRSQFPDSRVIVLGNRVAVLAPTEWEAISACQQVAAETEWSDWRGLPTNEGLFPHLRKTDWASTPVMKGTKNRGDVEAGFKGALQVVTSSYEVPYVKHVPIGPTMALADVRDDGSVTLYAASQGPQSLRAQIAQMLGTDVGKIVVRSLPGAGQFGRSNGGNAGAEDDAVLLSGEVGVPVRVQWMRAGDMQWSAQAAPSLGDIRIALDGGGRMIAYEADHYMPAMNDDRLVGAVLAGLPTVPAPGPDLKVTPYTATVNTILDPWIYDLVPNVEEQGYGTFQIGEKNSPTFIGLRSKSIRTPGHAQQNYARELAINEAAVLADADPIQFRLDHTTDRRLINVLTTVREESAWADGVRPAREGNIAYGRGVSAILRHGAYWSCVCHVSVDLDSGSVRVLKYTIAVDPGVIINPQQLRRQVEGGAVMGISRALFEEVHFDESGVTDQDWSTYPIMTMADLPDIKVVLISNPDVGAYGGGSEAANALAAPAIAAAFHDATGKYARRLPLRDEYVKTVLNS